MTKTKDEMMSFDKWWKEVGLTKALDAMDTDATVKSVMEFAWSSAIEASAKEVCRWCEENVPVEIKPFGEGFYYGNHTFEDGSTSECKAAMVLGLKIRELRK